MPERSPVVPPRSAAPRERIARAIGAGALAAAGALCAAQAPATSAPDPAPPEPRATIALVLPLESKDYGRAAEAVRSGFLAAASAAKANAAVEVIGHDDGGVVAAFELAARRGAKIVVGPLVRDDLKALGGAALELPVTIALNRFDDATALPPRTYALALAVESDARVLARRMLADGVTTVGIVGTNAPLMKRFGDAFVTEWLLVGGAAPKQLDFDPSPDGLAALRRDLGRTPLDAVLIAVEGPDAALVKSFATRTPAYASSQVHTLQAGATQRDLDGVVFVEVPWIVTPEARSFAGLPRPEAGSVALERLYALGVDAFHAARAFVDGVPERLEHDGATGRLVLGDLRQFQREGTLATFRNGRVVPLDGGR